MHMADRRKWMHRDVAVGLFTDDFERAERGVGVLAEYGKAEAVRQRRAPGWLSGAVQSAPGMIENTAYALPAKILLGAPGGAAVTTLNYGMQGTGEIYARIRTEAPEVRRRRRGVVAIASGLMYGGVGVGERCGAGMDWGGGGEDDRQVPGLRRR
jgi:hypothetical protein